MPEMIVDSRFQPDRRLIACALLMVVFFLPSCAPIVKDPPQEDQKERSDALDATLDEVSASGVIEVTPLIDPGIPPLLSRAEAAQAAGDNLKAKAYLDRALELAPTNPTVWQQLAELHLVAGHFADAATAARRSFDLGPKVGTLCARNWVTMARAFNAQGFGERAEHAHAEASDCPVRARERL